MNIEIIVFDSGMREPEDRGILLKDILEDDVPEKYFLSEKSIKGINYHKQRHEEAGNGFGAFLSDGNSKSGTILSRYYKDGKESLIITHNLQPRNGKGLGGKGHLQKEDGKSCCVDTGNAQAVEFTDKQADKYNKADVDESKSGCLTGAIGRGGSSDEYIAMLKKNQAITGKIRRLTPGECESLQTMPKGYTAKGIDIRFQTLYNGNDCNVNGETKCLKSVLSKDVVSPLQAGKLNSAINIILEKLGMELPNLAEIMSIKAKNVNLKDAKEISKLLSVSVLSTIKNGSEASLMMNLKNVRCAVKMSDRGRLECVLSTMLNLKEQELLTLKTSEAISHMATTKRNTIKMEMVDGLIEELQKRLLEENLKKEKLYTTLIWINLITARIILSFYPTVCTCLYIDSSNRLQGSLLETDLSSLRMENIFDVSDSARYKMLGNGWTRDVIAFLLQFMDAEVVKEAKAMEKQTTLLDILEVR